MSSAWASDEGISTSDAASNTTVQHSIIAEGLLDHSYGGLIQVDTSNTVISYHHNLFTNNRARNPRLGNKTGAHNVTDFRNNVVYNPDSAAGYSVSSEEGDGMPGFWELEHGLDPNVADNNGDVDGMDFLKWQRGYGSTYTSADLAEWEANYGMGAPLVAALTVVPEPSSLVLVALLAWLLVSPPMRRDCNAW